MYVREKMMNAPSDSDDGVENDELADMLVKAMTAEQLRRFAHHHGVARERGDTKAETAAKVVAKAREEAEKVDPDGRYLVWCPHCGSRGGMRYTVEDMERAVRDARGHKAANPTHFPVAFDFDDEERIYG